jgi:hypothetical protein
MYKQLGGPQGRCGPVEKIPPPICDSRNRPAPTDWVIPAQDKVLPFVNSAKYAWHDNPRVRNCGYFDLIFRGNDLVRRHSVLPYTVMLPNIRTLHMKTDGRWYPHYALCKNTYSFKIVISCYFVLPFFYGSEKKFLTFEKDTQTQAHQHR